MEDSQINQKEISEGTPKEITVKIIEDIPEEVHAAIAEGFPTRINIRSFEKG